MTRIDVMKSPGGIKTLKGKSQSRERKKTLFLCGFVLKYFFSSVIDFLQEIYTTVTPALKMQALCNCIAAYFIPCF